MLKKVSKKSQNFPKGVFCLTLQNLPTKIPKCQQQKKKSWKLKIKNISKSVKKFQKTSLKLKKKVAKNYPKFVKKYQNIPSKTPKKITKKCFFFLIPKTQQQQKKSRKIFPKQGIISQLMGTPSYLLHIGRPLWLPELRHTFLTYSKRSVTVASGIETILVERVLEQYLNS